MCCCLYLITAAQSTSVSCPSLLLGMSGRLEGELPWAEAEGHSLTQKEIQKRHMFTKRTCKNPVTKLKSDVLINSLAYSSPMLALAFLHLLCS